MASGSGRQSKRDNGIPRQMRILRRRVSVKLRQRSSAPDIILSFILRSGGEQWHALANIADLIKMLLWPNPTTYRGPKSRSKLDQCSQPGRCLEGESRSVARSLSAEMRVGAPQRRVPTDSTPRTYFSGLSADRQSLFPHWWKGLLGDTPMR